MTSESVAQAVIEAKRFLQRHEEWQEVQGQTYQYSTVGEHFPLSTPKENAALKRSSMDLSRALAQLRKY